MFGSSATPSTLGTPGPSGASAPLALPDAPDSDIPPLQSEEFLPPVSRWTTLGGYLMAGTLCGAIALASVVRYNVKVQASASVRPVGELNVVQSAIDGTVSAVKVQPNQVVREGDVIVEIAVDRNRLRVLQAKKNTLEGYIRQYQDKLANVNNQLRSVEREILAKAKVTPVPSNNQSQTGDQSKTLVAGALETLGKSGATLSNRRDRLLQQRLALENQIQYDGESLRAVTAEINKQIVKAPTDGKLLKLDVNYPGQPLRMGDPIARIVPQNAPLVVKGQVETQDISKVAIGQPVQMRVTAYPYPDYGVLPGKVQAIAPDVTTVRDGSGSGMSYYEVTIQPDQPYLTKNSRQYPLQAGMEVRADIISRQETLLQFLLRKARLWTDL
ncbi:HlyD family secretion protein [Leptothermofonsia sp. ETS-13]|uniref:HlyD family secretion protein n=1 Tax=Leptothermofonsia sp. ETS-13 TaxID=3035696 RepID=UPI003B9F3095